MARNDDGEFELILGNRQLLSVFFIVVILLGVFFTMGYIVGRNSAPLGSLDMAKKIDASRSAPADAPTATPPSDQPSAAVTAPPAERTPAPPAGTKPMGDEQKPSAAVQAQRPPEATRSSAMSDAPQTGQEYLQVAAVGKPEAGVFVDVLGKKGFKALYAQVPGSNVLYRVLVGPLTDAASIAKTRTDLESAGFKGYDAIVRKY
ncbi:MAG: SPOR domain-containing protein [Bryobacteraceae bacterium]